ncbi:MAG: glycosyltransferase family 39 protein [Planctomycetes bacterium]|nr:glycosyltransferase family 39 protein [Planctomycetota bacterium]
MSAKPLRLWIAIFVALAAGAFLRFQLLKSECFWFDEAAQVEWNDRPFLNFISDRFDQVDPPLNEIVAWAYNNTLRAVAPRLANSERAIRLPTVFYGLLMIVVMAFAAAEAFGEPAGIAAAALTAANPYLVRYSQEARMYSFMMLLTACALWATVRILKYGNAPDRDRRARIALGLFLGGAALAHYYTLVPAALLAAGSYIYWRKSREARHRELLQGAILALVVAIPYVAVQAIYVKLTGHGTRPWLGSLGRPDFETAVSTAKAYALDLIPSGLAAANAPAFERVLVIAGGVCFGTLILLGALAPRPGGDRPLQLLLILFSIGPFVMIFGLSQWHQLYHPRYLLATLPAMILLGSRFPWKTLLFIFTGVYAAACLGVGPRYREIIQKPDYRSAAAALAKEFESGDEVDVAVIDRLPMQYYLKRLGKPVDEIANAIEQSVSDRSQPPNPMAPRYKLRDARPRARIFEIDTLPGWSRLYVMDATELFMNRIPVDSPPVLHKLLFESRPFAYIRIWLRENARPR